MASGVARRRELAEVFVPVLVVSSSMAGTGSGVRGQPRETEDHHRDHAMNSLRRDTTCRSLLNGDGRRLMVAGAGSGGAGGEGSVPNRRHRSFHQAAGRLCRHAEVVAHLAVAAPTAVGRAAPCLVR